MGVKGADYGLVGVGQWLDGSTPPTGKLAPPKLARPGHGQNPCKVHEARSPKKFLASHIIYNYNI